MPSCYKIFEYWRDKCITKDGKVGGKDKDRGISVVRNEHSAECFACGALVKRTDMFSWDKYDMDLKDVWSDKRVNSKLQKAHVVAKQFGGLDVPENLFLLCSDCHYESPDTKNPSTFFRWVYRRRQDCAYGLRLKLFLDELSREIESRGYDIGEFAKKYVLCSETGEDMILTALENAGVHGVKIVESTAVGCIVDEIERKILDLEKSRLAERERELVGVFSKSEMKPLT